MAENVLHVGGEIPTHAHGLDTWCVRCEIEQLAGSEGAVEGVVVRIRIGSCTSSSCSRLPAGSTDDATGRTSGDSAAPPLSSSWDDPGSLGNDDSRSSSAWSALCFRMLLILARRCSRSFPVETQNSEIQE